MHPVSSAICLCNRRGHKEGTDRFDVGLEWIDSNLLCDLDYADDIILIDTSHCRMHMMRKAV